MPQFGPGYGGPGQQMPPGALQPTIYGGGQSTGFSLPYQSGEQLYPFGNSQNWNPWSYPGPPPGYTPSYDPSTMGVQSDPTAMNQFRNEALRTGPSRYANLANSQQDTLSMNARQEAASTNAGQQAQGQSQLAMTGGLDSGARERLQTEGNKNLLDMNQKIGQTTANNKMQIGMNDEQNRVSQLAQVPSMQNQQNQAAQFNIGNAITEGNNYNLYKYGMYGQQMKGWAANQQADATQNSGGSWLCTEALGASDMSRDDWKQLLKLRRYAYRKDPGRTAFYIYDCKPLIDRMKKSGANWQKNRDFVKHIVKLVSEGKLERAYKLYARKVRELLDYYWSDCQEPAYVQEVANG